MRTSKLGGVAGTAIAALATVALGSPALAATGAACQVSAGGADFGSAPLKANPTAVSYSLRAVLSGCQASASGVPTSGVASAGGIYSTTDPNGLVHQYREPKLSGNASCTANNTEGQLIVTWADESTTVLTLAAQPAPTLLADFVVSALPSITLAPVDPSDAPLVVRTTRYAGGLGFLQLAMLASPADCVGGIRTAPLAGALAIEGS